MFFFYSPGITVAHTATVVTLDRWEDFAILQSQIHWIWVLEYGNKLETRPQYSPSTCFDTFPIPCRPAPGLKEIGITLYEFRDEVMRELGKGATAVYNLVDKKSEKSDLIKKLRELHIEMDNTVALAYGWGDLDLRHGFYETKQGFRFTI
ncbi:type IIL restriction-modification enzyme MmeI, partial [Thiolapillus sp.]